MRNTLINLMRTPQRGDGTIRIGLVLIIALGTAVFSANVRAQDLPPGAYLRLGDVSPRQPGRIKNLLFTPDGKQILSSGTDAGSAVKLRDVSTRLLVREFPQMPTAASMAVSADGRFLATGTTNTQMASVWELQSGELVARFFPTAYGTWSGPTSVALSADGKTLVAGTPFGAIQIFDVPARRELHRIQMLDPEARLLSRGVQGMDLSPDGQTLAAGAYDGKLRYFDVAKGQRTLEFLAECDFVSDIAFSPDGRFLACLGLNDFRKNPNALPGLVVWDVERQEIRHRILPGEISAVGLSATSLLAFSPDSGRLLFTGQNRTPRIFDMITGHELITLPTKADAVAYSPDGTRVATADATGYVWYWDPDTGEELDAEPVAPVRTVRTMAIDEGGRVISATADARFHVWDTASGERLQSFPEEFRQPTDYPEAFGISPDRRWAAVGIGPHVELFDLSDQTSRELTEFGSPETGEQLGQGWTMHISFSQDGTRMAALHRQRHERPPRWWCRVWSLPDAAIENEFELHDLWKVHSAVLTADGRRLAMVRGKTDGRSILGNQVRVYDTNSGKVSCQFEVPDRFPHECVGACTPDGRYLAFGGEDDRIHFWDLEENREAFYLQGSVPGARIMEVTVSPDGGRVAAMAALNEHATSWRDVTQVWDLATGEQTHQFDFAGPALAFSPNGAQLGIASSDWSIYLFDLDDRRTRLSARTVPVDDGELERAWHDVGWKDVSYFGDHVVSTACRRLVEGGPATIEFLKARLFDASDGDLQPALDLLKQLDSDDDEARAAAVEYFSSFGSGTSSLIESLQEPRKAFRARIRLQALVRNMPDLRRGLAVRWVLPYMQSPEALALLRQVAEPEPANQQEREIVTTAKKELETIELLRSPATATTD